VTGRSCPQCGAPVGDTDDFCGNCGNYLGWAAERGRGGAGSGARDRSADAPGRSGAAGGGPDGEPAGGRSGDAAAPGRRTGGGDAAGGGSGGDRSAGGAAGGGFGGGAADSRAGGGAAGGRSGGAEVSGRSGGGATGVVGGRSGGDAAGGGALSGDAAGGGGSGDDGSGGGVAGDRSAGARAGDRPAGRGGRSARGRGPAYLGPVPPGRPEAKRPLPSAAVDDAVEGPPCPRCGTANPPGRRFCRRCAAPLHPDEAAARLTRRRRWRWRGDLSRWLRRLAALLVVAVLVLAVWLFHPNLLALWEDLRDRLATSAPVAPTGVTANAAVPDHPAASAADGLSNRYWGAPAVGDSAEFAFAAPFRLLSVIVHTGASAEQEGFLAQARPSAVDLVVTTADGAKRTVPVKLADKPGPQRTDTGISDVVRVTLVVRAAAGAAPGRHIALGEVEFFRRP